MERTVFDPLCMWIGLRGLICLTPEPVWGLLYMVCRWGARPGLRGVPCMVCRCLTP